MLAHAAVLVERVVGWGPWAVPRAPARVAGGRVVAAVRSAHQRAGQEARDQVSITNSHNTIICSPKVRQLYGQKKCDQIGVLILKKSFISFVSSLPGFRIGL